MVSRTRNFAILLSLYSLSALAAEREWQGLPLSEYISHLADQGLEIIYSNDLVHSDYVVTAEPTSHELIESLSEVLRPYGLSVSAGPGKTWLVVRDPDAKASVPTSEDASAARKHCLKLSLVPASTVFVTRRLVRTSFLIVNLRQACRILEKRRCDHWIGCQALRVAAFRPEVTSVEGQITNSCSYLTEFACTSPIT